jgi:hypothetical protein
MEETGQINANNVKDLFHDYFTATDNNELLSESISFIANSPSSDNKLECYENVKNLEDFLLDDNNDESAETEISSLINMLNQSFALKQSNESCLDNRNTEEILAILKQQPKTAKSSLNAAYTPFGKRISNKLGAKKISLSGRVIYDNSSTTPLRSSHPAFRFENIESNNIFRLASTTQLTINNESMK